MSLWLSSLQIPQEALQKIWKPEGHSIPAEVEKLVALLKKTKAPLSLEYQSLVKDYESYVNFCKSISMAPEDIQSMQSHEDFAGPKGLLGVVEETQSGDVLKEIRITYAEMERLRSLERTLKDLDGLIDILSKVKDRFASISEQNVREVRLHVNSTGKGLSLRLVYGHETPGAPAAPARKTIATEEVSFDSLSVEKWMEYGMKAILGRGKGEVTS